MSKTKWYQKPIYALVALALVLSLGIIAAPVAEVQANGSSQTLNVAQWTGPTATSVSGRETVLKVGTTYHMWYSPSDTAIYHTSSTDPASFTTTGTACTFTGGPPKEVGSVTVVEEGGTFYMIAYETDASVGDQKFAIYTSPATDGNVWTYAGTVFDGSVLTDINKIDAPYLFKDGDIYRLYFQVKTPADTPTRYDIYTAEATGTTLADIIASETGLDFTLANEGAPVLSPSTNASDWDSKCVMHPWVVKDGNNMYYMWYSAHDGDSANNQKMGFAYSSDGYSWTKSRGNPIMPDPTKGYAEPSVIKDGNTWRMWCIARGGTIASEAGIVYYEATGPFEFSTIQSAINKASDGDTINVAAGTYTEQVVINKSLTLQGAGAATTTIQAPTTTLTATSWMHSSKAFQALIEVNGASAYGITVNISGFTIDGLNKSSASPRYTGIVYHNANGTVSDNTITKFGDISADTLANSCENGWGIFVVEGSNVTISGNTIDNWAKGGIVVDRNDTDLLGSDVRATITGNIITGAGDEVITSVQNGIQVSRGAIGTISGNTISNIGFTPISYSAAGILVFESDGVTVTGNTLSQSETGVYVQDQNSAGGTSGNGNVVSNNAITESEYGVQVLRSTKTEISGNTISGSTLYGVAISCSSINTLVKNNTIGTSYGNGIYIGNMPGDNNPTPDNPTTGTVITGNTITENNTGKTSNSGGIFIDSSVAGSGVTVHLNNIVGNETYGIYNGGTGTLDATNNWWGDASGPSGVGNGTGDAVSANVTYSPWLDAAYPGGEPISFTDAKTESVTNDTLDAKTEADTEVVVQGTANVTAAEYSGNPGSSFSGDIGKYIDVHIDDASGVTELEVRLYYTDAEIAGLDESTLRMLWWNGTEWVACSPTGVNTTDVDGYSGYIWAKITNSSTPSLSDLVGAPFGGQGSPPAPPAVGGIAYPVNKLLVLAPWIALAVAIIAGATIFIRRRRAQG